MQLKMSVLLLQENETICGTTSTVSCSMTHNTSKKINTRINHLSSKFSARSNFRITLWVGKCI